MNINYILLFLTKLITMLHTYSGISFASFDVNATLQGLNFCFVPFQSALDYRGVGNHDHNKYEDPLNLTLNQQTFTHKLIKL